MSVGYFFDAGGYISHGDASPLFPVAEVSAKVHTHRDAERALEDVASEKVLAVRPTGMASSCALTQRPLAAVEIASLSSDTRTQIQRSIEEDFEQFVLIQIGRPSSPAQNRSLSEFS
jgi:hypothetical protein